VVAAEPAPASLDVEVLTGKGLAFPNPVFLGGQQLGEIGSGASEELGQPRQEALVQRRGTRDQPGGEERTERMEIIAGKGERGAHGSGGVPDPVPGIPQRVEDGAHSFLGSHPFVEEEQIYV
jgi:hypothetical protein